MKLLKENDLELMLSRMENEKPPGDLSSKIMDRILHEPIPSITSESLRFEKALLIISVVTALVATLLTADMSRLMMWLADAVLWMKSLLNSDEILLNSIASATAKLPAMSLMIILAASLLLILERIISRRYNKEFFLF